ncbi:methionine--tRNA ligase, chloroplastic/mitochondrial-like [Quercus lobata]|uniref:methionine--tRNA ligase, chloroplastic/mitochondrial-like n=1 Tax=Quercus lobata TaxID=97700 RepID=UPI00124873C8|nr:methionine--tRNA ligase, chloroplastic/mitochondrial-like [Quercus lobata]
MYETLRKKKKKGTVFSLSAFGLQIFTFLFFFIKLIFVHQSPSPCKKTQIQISDDELRRGGRRSQLRRFFFRLQLDISYDKFFRTIDLSDPKHESIVKEFYSRVLANGDICIYMKEFIVSAVRSIRMRKNCLITTVVWKEDNYYFALSKNKKFLEETLTQNPNFFQPSFRLNEVR